MHSFESAYITTALIEIPIVKAEFTICLYLNRSYTLTAKP